MSELLLRLAEPLAALARLGGYTEDPELAVAVAAALARTHTHPPATGQGEQSRVVIRKRGERHRAIIVRARRVTQDCRGKAREPRRAAGKALD